MADAQHKLHQEIDAFIQHTGDMYRSLDANGDGVVSTTELTNALKKKKAHATGRQAELFQVLIDHVGDVDKNHDNNISYVEFTRCCDKLKSKFGK